MEPTESYYAICGEKDKLYSDDRDPESIPPQSSSSSEQGSDYAEVAKTPPIRPPRQKGPTSCQIDDYAG